MDDLARWLEAQFAEDERIARAAGGRSEQVWQADLSGKDPLGMPSWPIAVRYTTDGRMRGAVANLPVMNERSEDRMIHIAAHDPARVLREIDAKRAILALHTQSIRDGGCQVCDVPGGRRLRPDACTTVRMLATVYADRPGYRDDWRP